MARDPSPLERALDAIATRRPRLIDLSLDRVFRVLGRLGDPQHRLPLTFHVAGTNGKGSTIAFLRAMLEAAGRSVHVYTSPHLVRFNERVTLAGETVTDAAMMAALEAVDEAAGDDPLTYFEVTTVAALTLFADAPADFLLLEVGLGGRLDATNVLRAPRAACVGPIGLDHQQFLGETIAEIAREKAGIFRAGAPAVIGRQSEEALAALLGEAERVGARPVVMGRDYDAYQEHGRLIFQDDRALLDLDAPRLGGAHQIDNAGLAIASLRAAGVDIAAEALSAGAVRAQWPARLQRLTEGPPASLARAHAARSEIWLDGGHNAHAGAAIARAMADLEGRAANPLYLIAGFQQNKDAFGYFRNFEGLARLVFAVAADHEGASEPMRVAAQARRAGLPAAACPDWETAARAIFAASEAPVRILICGSLYLAGEVLAGCDASTG